MPSSGVSNTVPLVPFPRDALQMKMKYGFPGELPGVYYNQYTPTAANCNGTSGSAVSVIGQNQLGVPQGGTQATAGQTVVTFSSSSGLLVTLSTAASWLPDTLNYNNMPVTFATASAGGTLPTNVIAGQVYYWQWVSATTGRLALTPGGTVLAYVNAGTATCYILAATQYWGSTYFPAGFLQASDTLYQASAGSLITPGCAVHADLWGTITSASTGNISMDFGLITAAGVYTTISDGGTNVALTAVGPFDFWYGVDFYVQQYGASTIASPYTAAGLIRSMGQFRWALSASTEKFIYNLASATTIDTTVPYNFDIRCNIGTAATGTYMEPLGCRITVIN